MTAESKINKKIQNVREKHASASKKSKIKKIPCALAFITQKKNLVRIRAHHGGHGLVDLTLQIGGHGGVVSSTRRLASISSIVARNDFAVLLKQTSDDDERRTFARLR